MAAFYSTNVWLILCSLGHRDIRHLAFVLPRSLRSRAPLIAIRKTVRRKAFLNTFKRRRRLRIVVTPKPRRASLEDYNDFQTARARDNIYKVWAAMPE